MGESRNAYRVLVGKPLERPRRRWEDNIKIDLRKMEYDGRDWINLAQERNRWWAYVGAAMNLRVSEKSFVTEREERRAKKRRSRWGGDEKEKTFIPGMPTVLPTNLSKEQEEAYLEEIISMCMILTPACIDGLHCSLRHCSEQGSGSCPDDGAAPKHWLF
ncbi:hypothetical protein ANN_05650 [Periplaneta americana]|uniref:Uncharacterized protein n=1 Tax=Periplaneta americana TaxID=6978 RepID=A0ABQ8TBE2_PERAM|nr:hypothetical protein ANN_05650 [Periplaneta americana]